MEKIYKESVYDGLEKPCNKIREIISNLLDEKAIEFSLMKRNSIYDTKYYYIKSRLKKEDSFYEKLIRKEIGIELIKALDIDDLNEQELAEKRGKIVTEINLLDDLIGLRIVTELKNDCENVHKLLLNSTNVFIEKQIKLTDLEYQPQRMQNGLEIYRIKGVYQDMYGFELQIKSKIDEAWGDLDHTLFYKDYSISPIKDTVQVTMNNVGQLLDRIEMLLFDLRDSGGNYSERAEHLHNQMLLEDELGPILKAKLGVTYNLKEMSVYLIFFRKKLNVGNQKLVDIDFDYLNYNVNADLEKSYIVIRNKSLTLQMLEGIYVSWRMIVSGQVTQENIHDVLNEYIQLLSEFISVELNYENLEDFAQYFNVLILNNCNTNIILKIKNHQTTKSIADRIDTISIDLPELDQSKDKVKLLLSVHFFGGESGQILEKLIEDEIEIVNILIEIKTVIKNSLLEADKLLNDLLTDLLGKLNDLMK